MNRVTDLNKGDLSSAQEIGELECVINNLQTRIAALERECYRLREENDLMRPWINTSGCPGCNWFPKTKDYQKCPKCGRALGGKEKI